MSKANLNIISALQLHLLVAAWPAPSKRRGVVMLFFNNVLNVNRVNMTEINKPIRLTTRQDHQYKEHQFRLI